MENKTFEQPDTISKIEEILRGTPRSSSRWSAEIVRLVLKSPDLSCLPGIETFNCIERIKASLSRDHYYSKDVLEKHRVSREECIYAMDKLFIHWKGIMLFSSL